jgi:hypothetical protein
VFPFKKLEFSTSRAFRGQAKSYSLVTAKEKAFNAKNKTPLPEIASSVRGVSGSEQGKNKNGFLQ